MLTIAGAFTAYQIGSGFATGQEILQYFTFYGYWGVLGAVCCLMLLAYASVSFLSVGRNQKLLKATDVYYYFCGKHIGWFYDCFSTLFCFLTLTVMIAGAGAVVAQNFNFPIVVGGLLMACLAFATVIFGLNMIVSIISKVGFVIAILVIVLSLVSLLNNFDNLSFDVIHHLIQSKVDEENFIRASNHWLMAAINYVGFCILLLGAFMATMGSLTKHDKEVWGGGILGAMWFCGAIIIVTLGLMAQFENVWDKQIPMLVLASDLTPAIATAFALIIFAGIYTTIVPLLWSVSSRITPEGTRKSNIVTAILIFFGLLIGLYLPFDKLLNIVYVVNGYVGAALLIFMFVKQLSLIKFNNIKIFYSK